MKMERYNIKFQQFTEQAKTMSRRCQSLGELKRNITELSCEAVQFYNKNSDYNDSDYKSRIEIFLEFDRLLKNLKREFTRKTPNNKSSFFSSGDNDRHVTQDPVLVPR